MRFSHAIETLLIEFRGGVRALTRSRAVGMTAIVTLALGIGATTAIYTVVRGVLLRPLPYKEAQQLVVIIAEQDFEGARRPVRTQWPSAAVSAWPATSTINQVAFYSRGNAALTNAGTSDLVNVTYVSESFFGTVDGEIALGRGLSPSEHISPSAVISERLWRRIYGGDPDVLLQSVRLNGQPYNIVGVAAGTFQIPDDRNDVWIPAGFARTRNPACCSFAAIARLTSGAALTTATDEVTAVARKLSTDMPRALEGVRVRLVPLHDFVVGEARPALLVLTAAVGLLLLIACANVMNLLLARDAARRHDTAIRRALGASRRRLILQALAETSLLTSAGAVLGVALTMASVRALKRWPPVRFPRLDTVEIDGGVLAFACAIAAATTVAMGLLPALRSDSENGSLKPGQKGVISAHVRRKALRTLTVAQLSMSVMLLVGAALLGRSFVALMRTDLGVIPERVATASLNLAIGRPLSDAQQIQLVSRVVDRVAAMPQVLAAGVGAARPPDASRMRLTLNRTDDPNARASFQAAAVPVTPGYFPALGIRLERGRFFTAQDDGTAPPAVIMSAHTARQLFGDQDAIGRKIQLPVLRDGATTSEEMTVVGITAPVKYNGIDQAADAVVYRPFAQQPWRSVFLIARTNGGPDALIPQLRREVAAVDNAITVSDASSLETVLADVTAQPRFRAVLLFAFASMSVVIATIGLYGVIAYSVSQRRAEIGIRMALGADSGRIRRMVLWEGLALALLGIALGLLGAYALGHLLSSLLYGIAPTDAVSFAAAAICVLVTGVAASYLPALGASRADPVTVLRSE